LLRRHVGCVNKHDLPLLGKYLGLGLHSLCLC
jgi:hypothetical protein